MFRSAGERPDSMNFLLIIVIVDPVDESVATELQLTWTRRRTPPPMLTFT